MGLKARESVSFSGYPTLSHCSDRRGDLVWRAVFGWQQWLPAVDQS